MVEMGVLTRLRAINWSLWVILVIPLAYIAFYIWTLIYKIIPWLNIAVVEIYRLTLLQIVATMIFFTLGSFLFIACWILVLGMVLG